jgi:hypothetical protein
METFEEKNISYNNALKNEYERIQGNFLQEIRAKIEEFKVKRQICRSKCLSHFCDDKIFSKLLGKKKDPMVCNQLRQMMESKGDYEVASFCKVSEVEKVVESCISANSMQKMIQDLFNMHKKNGSDPIVSKEESDFYALTTKPKSSLGGKFTKDRKKKRLPKRKRTNKKRC